MTYRGRMTNGAIMLEGGATLPEGTKVLVEPVESPSPPTKPTSVWQKLLELEGSAQELPSDLPERHDHYRRERVKP